MVDQFFWFGCPEFILVFKNSSKGFQFLIKIVLLPLKKKKKKKIVLLNLLSTLFNFVYIVCGCYIFVGWN
jgi:hypothetical protein